MKIVKLQAENIKRLKAVEVTPEGNMVVISGRNEQGKSSVLDSIWLALGGHEAVKATHTTRPVRDGAESASVVLDLGELKVTRKWTGNDKSYLEVESVEYGKLKTPQAILDKLIGKLTFDPSAYADMDDKEQARTLLSMVDLPHDPAKLDAAKKDAYDERTIINRDAKNLEGQIAGIVVPDDTPDEELKTADVLKEVQEAQEALNKNDRMRENLDQMKEDAVRLQTAIEETGTRIKVVSEEFEVDIDLAKTEYEKKLKQLQDEHKEKIARIDDRRKKNVEAIKNDKAELTAKLESVAIRGKVLETEVAALVDPDMESYQAKLAAVETTNEAVRAKKDRLAKEKQLAEVKAASDALTEKIQKIEEYKATMLKEAKMPLPGLGFDDGGVTYKGVPFRQCSSAERLRVSMAMAMALNPRLKIIRITDGSLLDSDNLRIIEEMAKEKDYQVWLEKVDETGKVGVYIEDGLVVAAPVAHPLAEE